ASLNHRMQTAVPSLRHSLSSASSASTWQSGHAPDGLMPRPSASRVDHPTRRTRTRSVKVRLALTSLTTSELVMFLVCSRNQVKVLEKIVCNTDWKTRPNHPIYAAT